MEFDVYPDLKLVWFRGRGEIQLDDLIANIGKVQAHPDFDFTFDTFVDFGEATTLMQPEKVDQYEGFFNKLQADTPPRRWAIFTRIEKTHIVAAMVHFPAGDNIQVDIFNNRSQALDWLGMPDPAEL